MGTKTVWSIFKSYINSKSPGTVITRQELLNQVEKELVEDGMCHWNADKKKTVATFSAVTLDYYRNMSEKMGFLEKMNVPGVYKVARWIYGCMTASELRAVYDECIKRNNWVKKGSDVINKI